MMIKRSTNQIVVCGVFAFAISNTFAAGVETYGKIHISTDRVDTGSQTDVGVSSNSTRLGFKGDSDLEQSWRALWKLESQLDATGESFEISARNRYVGIQTTAGTFLAGIHDSPMLELGNKTDFFIDSIGDGRAVRGVASDGTSYFNKRLKNVAVYISPNMSGIEVRGVTSPGITALETDPMFGGSVTYTGESLWGGFAYENQTFSGAARTVSGYRGGAGFGFGAVKVNVIGEYFSDTNAGSNIGRMGGGAGIQYSLGSFSIKGQTFLTRSSKAGNDNGLVWAAGAEQHLGKATSVYAMMSGIQNAPNSQFGIGPYHGDTYAGTANVSLTALSAGIEHSF